MAMLPSKDRRVGPPHLAVRSASEQANLTHRSALLMASKSNISASAASIPSIPFLRVSMAAKVDSRGSSPGLKLLSAVKDARWAAFSKLLSAACRRADSSTAWTSFAVTQLSAIMRNPSRLRSYPRSTCPICFPEKIEGKNSSRHYGKSEFAPDHDRTSGTLGRHRLHECLLSPSRRLRSSSDTGVTMSFKN